MDMYAEDVLLFAPMAETKASLLVEFSKHEIRGGQSGIRERYSFYYWRGETG